MLFWECCPLESVPGGNHCTTMFKCLQLSALPQPSVFCYARQDCKPAALAWHNHQCLLLPVELLVCSGDSWAEGLKGKVMSSPNIARQLSIRNATRAVTCTQKTRDVRDLPVLLHIVLMWGAPMFRGAASLSFGKGTGLCGAGPELRQRREPGAELHRPCRSSPSALPA